MSRLNHPCPAPFAMRTWLLAVTALGCSSGGKFTTESPSATGGEPTGLLAAGGTRARFASLVVNSGQSGGAVTQGVGGSNTTAVDALSSADASPARDASSVPLPRMAVVVHYRHHRQSQRSLRRLATRRQTLWPKRHLWHLESRGQHSRQHCISRNVDNYCRR